MGKLKKKSVKDLIGMFPQPVLAKIGSDTQVDWNVSRLYGDRMFKLLLFASLRSYRVSTRILEEYYASPFFSAFSGKGKHTTSHSSIASRLSKMNPLYFEQVFKWSNQIKSYTIAKIRFEEHLLLLIVNELKEKPPDKSGKHGFI